MKWTVIYIAFCFVLLTGCNDQSSDKKTTKTDTSKINPLEQAQNVKWLLQNIKYKGLVLKIIKGSKITFSYDASNRVASGKSTVNNYSGTLQVDQNGAMSWQEPGVSHTEMASMSSNADQLHRQEDAFLKAIMDVSHMEVNNGILIIKNKDGSTELKFAKAN